jgi:DNA-binding transcriptional regulator GbsR (MarR family)
VAHPASAAKFQPASVGSSVPATDIVHGHDLTQFEQGTIDVFVRMANALAVPKSVGEIYGLLFATPRPLAFQHITERLRISKGSASQGLRLLRANGAIKLVYMPGDRRDHFEPETELRALITGFLREKVQPHLQTGASRIDALQQIARSSALGPSDAPEAQILRARIDKLGSWQKKARTVVPLVAKLFG